MVATVTVNMGRAVQRSKRKLETVVQEFTQDLAEKAVERTPVDTGFLRGSWFTALDSPQNTFRGSEDKDGAATVARLSLTINQARPGQTIYVLNGARYARHVEFGTQNQRPRAFVRSTVADAPQILRSTVRRIRKV